MRKEGILAAILFVIVVSAFFVLDCQRTQLIADGPTPVYGQESADGQVILTLKAGDILPITDCIYIRKYFIWEVDVFGKKGYVSDGSYHRKVSNVLSNVDAPVVFNCCGIP